MTLECINIINNVRWIVCNQLIFEREDSMSTATLFSGTKTYFFSGGQYIRVTRGDTGAGTLDPGYPANISGWNWPAAFAASWSEIGGNFAFDAALSAAQRTILLDRHQFAFGQIQGCGNLNNAQKAALTEAYRRPIRHGITLNANNNASAFPNLNMIYVNTTNFFAISNDERAQTLIHEMVHCAGFTHPDLRRPPAGMSCASPNPAIFDCPNDNGQYYGTPPLQAEICIAGVQSDRVCVTTPDGCVIER